MGKIETIFGTAESTDIKVEPYGNETYTLCYLHSDGEGNYDLLGFDAPTEDDPEWRFWVESGDDDGCAETNKVYLTKDEKDYIKSLYYSYKDTK